MAGAGAKGGAAGAAGEVPDYYGLLGVGIESSVKEIAAAYRRAARKVHPDKNPDDPKAGTDEDENAGTSEDARVRTVARARGLSAG